MPNILEVLRPRTEKPPATANGEGLGYAFRAGQQRRIYRQAQASATALRTLFNDDGPFLGLEVLR